MAHDVLQYIKEGSLDVMIAVCYTFFFCTSITNTFGQNSREAQITVVQISKSNSDEALEDPNQTRFFDNDVTDIKGLYWHPLKKVSLGISLGLFNSSLSNGGTSLLSSGVAVNEQVLTKAKGWSSGIYFRTPPQNIGRISFWLYSGIESRLTYNRTTTVSIRADFTDSLLIIKRIRSDPNRQRYSLAISPTLSYKVLPNTFVNVEYVLGGFYERSNGMSISTNSTSVNSEVSSFDTQSSNVKTTSIGILRSFQFSFSYRF